jgi:hypothetical protein
MKTSLEDAIDDLVALDQLRVRSAQLRDAGRVALLSSLQPQKHAEAIHWQETDFYGEEALIIKALCHPKAERHFARAH